ncbi:MAG: hypothetical protein HGB10_01165 [Coriobacteriia bacterium]|nr:hypothetical protein [Coriobacteriia bacterium]
MAPEPNSGGVPAVIERFVRQLAIAYKAVSLYPPSSAIPREAGRNTVAVLEEALAHLPEVRIAVTRDGLFFDEMPILDGRQGILSFAREFYNRMLSDVRFHSGTDADDLLAFLTLLSVPAEELAATGGFETRFWEQNVGTITVTEARIALIDAEAPAFLDETKALTVEEIDDLVARARRGAAGEQTTIARFMSNPAAVRDYLSESLLAGGASGFERMSDAFFRLAHLAWALEDDQRDERMRSLAEAALGLAQDVRSELLAEKLLPQARSSAPLAAVVRQMEAEELCRMFATGSTTEGVRIAMVRAIRNLSTISGIDKDGLMRAAGSVLLEQGMSADEIDSILAEAAPAQLPVVDTSGAAFSRPSDVVIELIDKAPMAAQSTDADPEIVALREEAAHGITDGDVIAALVTLVTLDDSGEAFDVTMGRIESAVSLLIERGEFEVAVEVSAMIGAASQSGSLSAEQRTRLARSVSHFASPRDLRSIVQALRVYPQHSIEHESATRLIAMLGSLAIKPMLDQLADEPDMAARKSLVETLSALAPAYIAELGEGVTDPRWYFVRNVVSILGSTKSPTILPYLERVLRHPDARVRRETVRALSNQGDRLAAQMMIQYLSDEDAQNVQLAARFIGQKGMTDAVSALEQVARGEGRGNREMGPRVEAIEALGRLRAVQALPTLQSLAGRRALLGGGKSRELRSAAETAIQRVHGNGGAS